MLSAAIRSTKLTATAWLIHGIVDDPGEVAAQAFQVEGEIDLQDPAPPASSSFGFTITQLLTTGFFFPHLRSVGEGTEAEIRALAARTRPKAISDQSR
jgi:hypothetical protein